MAGEFKSVSKFLLTSFMKGRKSSTLEGKNASPESNLSNGAYDLARQARRPLEAPVPGHVAAAMSSGPARATCSLTQNLDPSKILKPQ